MKYLVMECGLSYAIVLDEEGRFLKAANLPNPINRRPYRARYFLWVLWRHAFVLSHYWRFNIYSCRWAVCGCRLTPTSLSRSTA